MLANLAKVLWMFDLLVHSLRLNFGRFIRDFEKIIMSNFTVWPDSGSVREEFEILPFRSKIRSHKPMIFFLEETDYMEMSSLETLGTSNSSSGESQELFLYTDTAMVCIC